ncbi:MAG: ATP-grasp domain-containing protein [Anaerolineae bacterium]
MTTIALATCADQATLFHDEAPLVTALEQRGFEVFITIWNSPEIDWYSYDRVLIRNTWDYHNQAQVFMQWLDHLDQQGVPVVNPTALVRWNMNKRYLHALAQEGIHTLPTRFVAGDTVTLAEVLAQEGWAQAVTKPVIGGSEDHIQVITPDSALAYQQEFEWLNSSIGMMVQAFAPQIQREGEYSLVFYRGVYSHAVLKQAADGSIFVHEERGGRIARITPPPSLIAQAKNVIDTAHRLTGILPVYARVDGVRDGEQLVLMELECIKPELYFSRYAHASQGLVTALIDAST